MPLNNNIHYVKFIRGSTAAWEALLQTPQQIDNDTLYFIYESAQNSTEGKLYLGQKLISGSSAGDNININDLNNISIDNETLDHKQILVYNENTGKWENASLESIINTAVNDFVGATETTDGQAGLVPVPTSADRYSFIRGDKTWVSFNPNIFQTINNEMTLAGISQAPIGSIPVKTSTGIEWSSAGAGTISRTITTLEDLTTAVENHTASENTIYMVPAEDVDSSNSYDEYLVINNKIERIGTIGDVNLSDYVTKSAFDTTVGTLNSANSELEDKVTILETGVGDLSQLIANNTTLVDELNSINETLDDLSDRLQWNELTQE